MATTPDRERQLQEDAAQLQRLGYAQQLLRDMGGFSNFAVSFSIISILTGAVTLYGHGLRFGGPYVMGVGWPLVAVMTLAVAASLAQLASSFPTAGALYHWAAMLGGPRVGFFTAWLNTVGQFAITAGIDYGLAEFLADMLGLPRERGAVLSLYAAILLSHAMLNHVGVRVVAWLNDFSAWYHLAGVALLIGALAALAPRQDAAFLLTRFSSESPSWYVYGFLIGLLQAQWTFTGYDASAHISEETRDPTRNAPWGIFLSVAVSAVVGYVLLGAVTLAIQDLPAAAAAPNPFLYVLTSALGPSVGGALVWVAIGAMWFCGLSSVTSNSRMLFAFARDNGLPGSRWLKHVSPRFRSPSVAVWVSVAAAFVVALWAEAYAAMVALSTLALYASYARIRPADAVLQGIVELSGSGHPWMDAEESREAGVAAGGRGVRGQRADAAGVRRTPGATPEHLAVLGLPSPAPGGRCSPDACAPAAGAGEQRARTGHYAAGARPAQRRAGAVRAGRGRRIPGAAGGRPGARCVLTLPASVRILLATSPVDMRKSIDGLMALVRTSWGEDVYSGHLFAFVSRRGDRVKILTFSRGGFVLYYKRLEQGRFRLPPVDAQAQAVQLDATQLAMLLDGIDVAEVKRQPAWTPPGRTGT